MARLSIIIIFSMFLIHTSCQSPQSRETLHTNQNPEETMTQELSHISFSDGSLLKNMNKISGITDTILIFVNKPDSAVITLLSAADTANIRIAQLFLPDGTVDGPFGKDLKYRFKDTGDYYITVNENLMVGNHYTGPYQVKMVITNHGH
jgi:hypothetical protein